MAEHSGGEKGVKCGAGTIDGIFDGIRVSLFAAGRGGLDTRARAQAIQMSNGLVAWGKGGGFTRAAWADITVAASQRKPLYFGGDMGAPDLIIQNAEVLRARVFPNTSIQELWALAGWFAVYDPKFECAGPDFDGASWLRHIQRCETPIERKLAVHLLSVSQRFPFDILPQHEVDTSAGKYRLDFAVVAPDYDLKLAIEADGHDFHERTKEQAAHDRSRDRTLTLAGWTVLRFTGSEIWRDPHACAQQVYECVSAAHEKTLVLHDDT